MKKLRRDTIAEDDYTILDYGWDDRLEGKEKTITHTPLTIGNTMNGRKVG